MPPMDINDWWLAAAAAAAATGISAAPVSAATSPSGQVGIATAVRPGVVSATNERVVYIGNAVTFGERFKTDSTGTIHILFMDQSSMTLGPNSELVIDEFTFHPETKRGSISIKFIQGALRVVGGFVSKFSSSQGRSAVQVRAPTATIGIRGGITLVQADQNNTQGIFLFGDEMEFSTTDGTLLHTVNRPGFSVSSGPDGVGSPLRHPSQDLSRQLGQFSGTPPQGSPPSGGGGNLISTNDRPDGLESPNSTLANDRAQSVTMDLNTNSPDNTLRNVLGIPVTPIQS
nr:FecR domain-containing protein [Rhodoferax sp.]